MTRQLKIAALGLAAFIAAALTVVVPMVAEESPPAKARVLAEYCMFIIWPGCLEDTTDRRVFYLLTRRDLGGGLYEDTYRFEGPVPGQEGRRGYLRKIVTYRGLFDLSETRLISVLYSPEEAKGKKEFEAGEVERTKHLVWKSSYGNADLADLFNRLMNGEEVILAESADVSHKTYFCIDPKSCDENKNSHEIEVGTFSQKNTHRWQLTGRALLELPEGPLPVLTIEQDRSRYWYDPVSEQIVRATAINPSGEYQLYRLRLQTVGKSADPQKD